MARHAPEIIDFLDRHWCTQMWSQAMRRPLAASPEESVRKLEELRRAFHLELESMPEAQVESLATRVLHEQDLARPFNGYATEADFSHFGRCPYLTAFEAVPLSMGKDPRRVTWAMVNSYLGSSLFANEYADRLDRLDRAIRIGQLPEKFTPLQFLTWAHEYKMKVPDAFAHHTFVRGQPIQYWHEVCEEQRVQLAKAAAELETERAANSALLRRNAELAQQTFTDWQKSQGQIAILWTEKEEQISSLHTEIKKVRAQNSTLQKQVQELSTQADSFENFPTTERQSLLTLSIVASVEGLGYDPGASKSPIPKQLADAASLMGLKLSDDTARKYLKEATTLKGFKNPINARPKPKSAKLKPKSV